MDGSKSKGGPQWLKVGLLLALLFLFMSSVRMMGGGFKLLGAPFSETLLSVTGSPIVALMIGVMTTAVVQSSSLTTCLVVGLVTSGAVTVENAVPIVMGANVGTTITCSLVSLAYVGKRRSFCRAFAAATMHDFFNFAMIALMLPLELATGILSKTALYLAERFAAVTRFSSDESPLKAATGLLCDCTRRLFERTEIDPWLAAAVMLAVGLGLLFVSLYFLTKLLQGFMAERMGRIMDRYLFRTAAAAFVVGLGFTATVQSSSVTTSLMVPLVASGVLRQVQAFPYVMGAHLGTTVTGLMAALGAGDPSGLAVALCHVMYNLTGVLIFLPWRRVRNIPVRLSRKLAGLTLRSRWYALVYIATVFFIIPLIVILLFR